MRWLAAVAVLLVTCVAGFALVVLQGDGSSPGSRLEPGEAAALGQPEWDFTIPEGTTVRLARGEELSIVPARIDARVGDVLRIRNLDYVGYLFGPFYVGAHETLTQRLTDPGVYRGSCSIHPSGELVLSVSP